MPRKIGSGRDGIVSRDRRWPARRGDLDGASAEALLEQGRGSLVSVGRPLLGDPYWPVRAALELGVRSNALGLRRGAAGQEDIPTRRSAELYPRPIIRSTSTVARRCRPSGLGSEDRMGLGRALTKRRSWSWRRPRQHRRTPLRVGSRGGIDNGWHKGCESTRVARVRFGRRGCAHEHRLRLLGKQRNARFGRAFEDRISRVVERDSAQGSLRITSRAPSKPSRRSTPKVECSGTRCNCWCATTRPNRALV